MCVQCVSAWPPLTFPPKTQLILNTHITVAGIYQGTSSTDGQKRVVSDMLTFYHFPTRADHCLDSERVKDFDYQEIRRLISAPSVPGAVPPPAPRICYERDQLIDRIRVRSAECLTPIALIGAAGIGKSSIILTTRSFAPSSRLFHHPRLGAVQCQ